MDPREWRKRQGWSLREMARLLGCASAMGVYRWEIGRRDAPTSVAMAYERITRGAVAAKDLNTARRKFLGRHGWTEETGEAKAV